MILQKPNLVTKPVSKDVLTEKIIFVFEANSEYSNYSVYGIFITLSINSNNTFIKRPFIDGVAVIDIKDYLVPFLSEPDFHNSSIKPNATLNYSISYYSYTPIEATTNSESTTYQFTIYPINLPENLQSYLTQYNLSLTNFTNIKGLLLNPLLTQRVDLTTSYLKQEYFSFILASPQASYSIEYTLVGGAVETQVFYADFLADTIYTIPFKLTYSQVKSYKFKIGSIYQNYVVDLKQKRQSYCLVYVNSYNLLDSIELTGQAQQMAVLSKLNYLRYDVNKSYDNKYKIEYVFSTQFLTNTENFNLIEFVNSKQIWLEIKGNWEELSLDMSDFSLKTDGEFFKINEIKAITSRYFDRFLTDKIEGISLSPSATTNSFVLTDDSGNKYTMFFRTVVSPLTYLIVQTWKLAYSHTIIANYFYMRVSRDGGATYKSIDGTAAYSKINLSDWINNPTPVYTSTGRLIIFFQWSANSSAPRTKACYMYSDDDGVSWSAMRYFTDPSIGYTITGNAYFYSNKILYNQSGELLIPYWLRIVETGRSSLRIAKSSDNGHTWTDYKCVFQNATGTKMEMTESEWVDAGEGHFIMITRTSQFANLSGDVVPAIFYSSNYGATWHSDTIPHTVESLTAKNNKCGFIYLEGPGKSLGVIGATFNEPLPSINLITEAGEKWLVIFYWIRLANEGDYQWTVQKWTVLKVEDFLANGVDAVKNISQELYDGSDHSGLNANGGNGCADNFGDDLIFSSYVQDTASSSGGTSTLYNVIIRRSEIQALISLYNNA